MKSILKFYTFILSSVLFFHLSCKKEHSCENCKGNKPPIANAGPDQLTVLPKDSVMLDGTASTDPDGTIISYKWIKISGPVSSNILETDSSKTLVRTLVMGVYKFELTVTDNGGFSAKDTVQIIVNDPAHNQPPVANAGTDQTITLPTDTVSLNGNLSFDPDGTIVSYQWTKISGPSSFNIVNANSVQTKVNGLAQGVYLFELKVTDNGALIGKDTMQITVNTITPINIPPIAKAGNDTIIQTNQTSCTPVPITITLNGNNSYDPDGNIVSYSWTGPGNIISSNSAVTTVTGLVPISSTFILKVTDNNGAFGYDTIKITLLLANRPLVQAQLIPIGTLSQARSAVAIGAAGNKILFAGGGVPPGYCGTSRVDIYDINSNSWSTSELSEARYGIGVALLGNKIFFGGGFSPKNFANSTTCYIGNGWYSDTRSSAIDIYDASSNTWSTSQLSTRRTPQGASAGNKVLFAGGDEWGGAASPSNAIDSYDGNTNSWNTGSLSETKGLPQIAATGSKMFLAGGAALLDGDNFFGITKRIDIYDAVSGQWSVDFLSIERASMGSIAANNKIYWAGGVVANSDPNIVYEATSLVEIRDITTNTTTFDCLSEPRAQLTAIRKDNKIIFFGKYNVTRFDIFDLSTNSWSIGVLSQNINGSIISYNNIVYVTDGNHVWKLDF